MKEKQKSSVTKKSFVLSMQKMSKNILVISNRFLFSYSILT